MDETAAAAAGCADVDRGSVACGLAYVLWSRSPSAETSSMSSSASAVTNAMWLRAPEAWW